MTAAPAGAPAVRVVDARTAGIEDERRLRAWARAATAASGAAHVTRSYRYPYAAIAWHSRPLGIDIERIEPCDEAFAQLICTPAERADPARLADPDTYLTTLWSAKEALSKALGDALRYEPGRLESPMSWPQGAAGPWRAHRVAAPERHVCWVVWQAAQSAQR